MESSFSTGQRVSSLLFSGALLLLSACATTIPTEQIIEERATARWNAVLSDDLAGAYEFLTPGYRSSVSSVQYQRLMLLKQVEWTDARYIESECTETTCKVKISIDYALHSAVPGVKKFRGTQTAEESWLMVDGNWYFVPKN